MTSRGHMALELLEELVAELDRSPVSMAVLLSRPGLSGLLDLACRARTLVDAKHRRPTSAPLDREWCTWCLAIHPGANAPEPEPHGRRRAP